MKVSPRPGGRAILATPMDPRFDADTPNAPMLEALLAGRVPGRVYADGDAVVAVLAYHALTFVGPGTRGAFVAGVAAEVGPLLVVTAGEGPGRARVEFRALSAEGATDPRVRRLRGADLGRCTWRDEVLRACGTPEAFDTHALGVAVAEGDALLAEAYACFRGEGRAEVGVVTRSDQRRRGLAGVVCRALVAELRTCGLAPTWSCDTGNEASVRTATALGFTGARPYRLVPVG